MHEMVVNTLLKGSTELYRPGFFDISFVIKNSIFFTTKSGTSKGFKQTLIFVTIN